LEVAETAPGAELELRGRLDARTLPHARAALHGAVDAGTGDLVVDVAALEVWDAAGLGLLLGAHHRAARRGRRLVLRDPSPRLRRLVRLARLQRVLTTVETVAAGSGRALLG
jgi:anti-anti-sigma factor